MTRLLTEPERASLNATRQADYRRALPGRQAQGTDFRHCRTATEMGVVKEGGDADTYRSLELHSTRMADHEAADRVLSLALSKAGLPCPQRLALEREDTGRASTSLDARALRSLGLNPAFAGARDEASALEIAANLRQPIKR